MIFLSAVLLNAPSPISVLPLEEMSTSVRLSLPAKASFPIDVTDEGIVTLERSVSLKAPSPIDPSEEADEKSTSLRFSAPLNAPSAIAVTPSETTTVLTLFLSAGFSKPPNSVTA